MKGKILTIVVMGICFLTVWSLACNKRKKITTLSEAQQRVLERILKSPPPELAPIESIGAPQEVATILVPTSRETILSRNRRQRPIAEAVTYKIGDYARECNAAVGPLSPFNCLDGQIIPITRNGVELQPGSHTKVGECDKPPLLGLQPRDEKEYEGQCVPYARLGRLPGLNSAGQQDPDVEWVFICRRYKIGKDPNYPNFDDVAVIGHRKSTGDTCFYQTLSDEKRFPDDTKRFPDGIPATRVPPPDERVEDTPAGQMTAEDFWLTPEETANINCYTCHDNDVWIRTRTSSRLRIYKPGTFSCLPGVILQIHTNSWEANFSRTGRHPHILIS